jgi:hypothetical protein
MAEGLGSRQRARVCTALLWLASCMPELSQLAAPLKGTIFSIIVIISYNCIKSELLKKAHPFAECAFAQVHYV